MRNFTKTIFSVVAILMMVTGVNAQAPTISSFSPTTAGAGTSVTITGTNLGSVFLVNFGGKAAASFYIVNSTTIVATVGTGNSGSINVTAGSNTGTLAGFTFCGSVTPTISIIPNSNNVPYGSSVSFNASATNGGTSPNYQFNINDLAVQSGSSNIFSTNLLQNGDVVNCTITSNAACLANNIVTSNNQLIHITGTNPSQWADVGNQPFESAKGIRLAVNSGNIPFVYFMDTLHQNKGIVKNFVNNSWGNVGDSASLPKYGEMAFSPTGILYLAGYVDTSTKITVLRFVNGAWQSVGTTNPIPYNASQIRISFATDGTPYLGYTVYDNVTTFYNLPSIMRFDGTNWVYVGSPNFYSGGVNWFDFKVSPQDVPYVVMGDNSQPSIAMTCLKYDGSNWVVVGTKGFTTASNYVTMAFTSDGTLYVCGSGRTGQNATIYKRAVVYNYNGTNWQTVGGQYVSTDTANYPVLVMSSSNIPIVMYQKSPVNNDPTQFYMLARKLENGSWNQIGGNISGISRLEGSKYSAIAPMSNGAFYAAFANTSVATSFVKQYGTVVLPLNLLAFTAQQQNNAVNLSWQTTNEVNTSHFTIQRSVDGTSFNSIGKVIAKGDGSYSYTDSQLPSASVVYYRLQMVDKDGSFTYSKVVAVTLVDNRKTLVLFPNPVKDNLFVQFTSTRAEKLTLQVTDLQGRILQQEDTQVGVGNVSLSVNTSALAKGTYVLLVKGSTGVQQKQFVKE